MIWLTLPDRDVDRVAGQVEALAPGAFWTLQPKSRTAVVTIGGASDPAV